MKIIISLLLAASSLAAEPHSHGTGSLSIAFDGASGKIELRASSESFFGFEHEAKTEKDVKSREEGLEKLEAKIGHMISFEPSMKCVMTKEKIEILAGKTTKHSDTVANFSVVCEKSVVGTRITFQFRKHFPRLKDVDIVVLAGEVQAHGQAQKDGDSVEVK